MGFAQWFGWMKLKRTWFQKLVTIYFCPITTITEAEKDFNNQVYKRPVLWTPASLFLQSLLLLLNKLMNKVAMKAGMGVVHRLSNMDSYSPRLPSLLLLLNVQSTSNRDQYSVPRMKLFPSQLLGGRLVVLKCFHDRRSSLLFLVEMILYMDMDLPSLHAILRPNLLSMNLWCVFYYHILQHCF